MDFKPRDPQYESKVKDSFSRQPFMEYLGAQLTIIRPGYCEIQVPYRRELTQQHRYFHAGVIGTVGDTAGGYAAFSLMPANSSVLTIEYKMNLMTPGKGDKLIAKGQVIRSGKTITVCHVDVFQSKNSVKTLCAILQMTVMTLVGKPDK